MNNKKLTIAYFKKCKQDAELEIADAVEKAFAKFETRTGGYTPSGVDISMLSTRTIVQVNEKLFLDNVKIDVEI